MEEIMNIGLFNHNHVGEEGGGSFCTGKMGMVMYMDGFRWAMKGGQPCINLYFSVWKLNSKLKLIIAMIGIFLLAIGTEGISKYRHILSIRLKQLQQQQNQNKTTSTTTTSSSSIKKQQKQQQKRIRIVQTGLHGLHALTGYILMLGAMTFVLELLLSVIFGLIVGYVLFGGDQYNHVTTNPCCAFLEDEQATSSSTSSNEQQQQQQRIPTTSNNNNNTNTTMRRRIIMPQVGGGGTNGSDGGLGFGSSSRETDQLTSSIPNGDDVGSGVGGGEKDESTTLLSETMVDESNNPMDC